jgi:baculoviral IAP repeat-containing protein 7/8
MSLIFNQKLTSITSVESGIICTKGYDLNKESDRLRTFRDNFWRNEFIHHEGLALVGFYFHKHPDIVKCNFCHIIIHDFEAGDTPLGEHYKHSPNCPLLKRRKTDNEPVDALRLDQILPPVSYDECGFQSKKHSPTKESIKHPEYRLVQQRIKSYDSWPIGIKQKPNELAEAGFFYSGQSDRTTCFACGLEIFQWSPDDNVSDCATLKKLINFLQL